MNSVNSPFMQLSPKGVSTHPSLTAQPQVTNYFTKDETFENYQTDKRKKISSNVTQALGNTTNSDRFQYTNGDITINTNGKAYSIDNEKIVCRHLAYEWLQQKSNIEQKKTWRNEFKDINSLSKNPQLAMNDYDEKKIAYKASSYYPCDIDKFGEELYNAVQDIKLEQTKSMLLTSTNHAMAIRVSAKKNPNRYIVTFFDPNKTAASIRIVCKNLAEIKTITINDVLDNKRINSWYFPGELKFGMFSIYDMDSIPNEKTTTSQNVFKDFVVDDKKILAQLCVALMSGNTTFVTELVSNILSNKFSDKQKIQLLEAKRFDGERCLTLALYYGHTDTVAAFTKLILDSELEDDDKTTLLNAEHFDSSARVKNATPGLYFAWINGHKDTVATFTKLILDSKLEDYDKTSLLNISYNYSILSMALKKDHKDMVTIFTKLILDSKLDNDQKMVLLETYFNDVSVLYQLLREGDKNAVAKFTELILNSRLDNEQKVKLLESKCGGAPGLFSAFTHGHKSTVAVFTKLILGSELKNEDKIKLLEAKNFNGISGLSMALQNGHKDTVEEFKHLIKNSNLDDYQKKQIVTQHNAKSFKHRFDIIKTALAKWQK